MSVKSWVTGCACLLVVGRVILLHGQIATNQSASTRSALPPIVYVCPMVGDEEVLEDKPGSCPKCRMTLKGVRLVSKHSCPIHPTQQVQDGPGRCRIDGRDLVPVTLSMLWACPGGTEDFIEPGTCADGKTRPLRYEVRAHGDHNPRHGGQFFMAQDAWHHLEGTLQPGNVFRLFFYDNYTKPLDAGKFDGRAVTKEAWDPAAKVSKDVEFVELRRGKDRSTLEAVLHGVTVPAKISAKIRFNAQQTPQRFDFMFAEHSVEPASVPDPVVRSASRLSEPRRERDESAASTDPKSQAQASVPAPGTSRTNSDAQQTVVITAPMALTPELDESLLPRSTSELMNELGKRTEEVRRTIAEGNLAQVWLPAMATKTVALALESSSHYSTLPAGNRVRASAAVSRIVAAAWELDSYGDIGNRERISGAFGRLESAVAELKAAYGVSPR